MFTTIIYTLEIILSIIGVILIFMQTPGDFSDSFSAGSLEAFKLQSGRDKLLFWGTVLVIALLIVVIIIDLKFVV